MAELAQRAGDDGISFVADMAAALPLFQDQDLIDGQHMAYVCPDFVCRAPVTKVAGLRT
jgi:uncharacterized protein YyaL (SSP411 family)